MNHSSKNRGLDWVCLYWVIKIFEPQLADFWDTLDKQFFEAKKRCNPRFFNVWRITKLVYKPG